MRNFFFFIFSTLLYNLVTGCAGPDEKTQALILTTVPFSNAKEFKLSDFVEEKKFILLSTGEDALFRRVDKLIAKNDQFYLFDHLANSGVLVFDAEGNFIQKIGEFGEGPQQLKRITDFQVLDNGDVLILDSSTQSITTYSEDGMWKQKVKLPVSAGGFSQLGDRWFLAINYDHQSNDLSNNPVLGVFDNTMKADSLYFQYTKGAINANVYYHAGLLATSKNALVYHRPPNDTISVFNSEVRLTDRLLIDFGDKRLPAEAVNDFQLVRDYKAQEASFQYLQTPAMLVDKYILGIVTSTKNEIWTYIYNLDSKELYASKIDLNQLHLQEVLLPTAQLGDNAVISLIDPDTFSQDANPGSYPEDVRKHLENEGSALLIHYLK